MSVTIRPITEYDTDNIIAWRNSDDVKRYFIDRTPLTKDAHLNWLHTKVQSGKVAQFIIHSEELNKDVGSVYIRDIDTQHRKGEFGIFIGIPEARNKGIGSKATKLILEYGFKVLKLNRIYLRVLSKNIVAISSYQKSGFIQDGLFRQDVFVDKKYEDVIFMSVLHEDYIKHS